MYQLRLQASFFGLRFLNPVLQVGWSVGGTVAKPVGQLFRGLLEGSSEEEEGHHHRPIPPSSDDASAAAADDDVGGNRLQGFRCLFVGRLDLSPHAANAASEAARELRRQRRPRHPRWQ